MRVDEKTNEIPVAQAVLPTLPIKHRVCTADALHTQTDFMRVIHAQQAETVLTVKGNQPTLSPTKASPQRLLALNRGHWSIGAIRFAETSEKLGDGEQGGERSLTTERVTWGAIPHPLGERGNAAPSR